MVASKSGFTLRSGSNKLCHWDSRLDPSLGFCFLKLPNVVFCVVLWYSMPSYGAFLIRAPSLRNNWRLWPSRVGLKGRCCWLKLWHGAWNPCSINWYKFGIFTSQHFYNEILSLWMSEIWMGKSCSKWQFLQQYKYTMPRFLYKGW